jgi:hypothetical protein
MAPGAQWIACKGCPTSACPEDTLLSCGDWVLAPAGSPRNRPHIVLNPWGGASGSDWFKATVQAWRAAGIFPSMIVGNSSGACGTAGSPGDYQESMASAAHDSGRAVASFSARGPGAFGDDPFTKPNISAPGVAVCSSVPTDGWSCGYNGTGMAAAHTAGAVALVWEACPAYLGDIDGTMDLLQRTADAAPAGDCGAPPDGEGNYTYGYGYLNVQRAVEQCQAEIEHWTEVGPLCFGMFRFDGYYHPTTNKAYFLGGRTGGATTSGDIYSFDPATGACADTGDDMPVPISNYVVVPYRDPKTRTTYLCTVGGRNATGSYINDVQCYDPVSHNVGTVSRVPRAYAGWQIGGAASVNNKIYIFGGLRWTPDYAETDMTVEWDPATDTWTGKAAMSQARGYIMSAVVDGKIYAFGGDVFDPSGLLVAQSTAERFDPAVGKWSDAAVTDLPFPSGEGQAYGFGSASSTMVKGGVVLAGGGQWPYDTAEGLVYNVSSDSYDYGFPDLNVSRRLHASFYDVDRDRLWVVAGRSSDPGYGGDEPPYAPAEYVDLVARVYLPLVVRAWAP